MSRHTTIGCSPELFVEMYIDLNHVPIIHQGLNSWVDVRKAEVEVTPSSLIQVAPFNPTPIKRGKYRAYYEAWMDAMGVPPEFGAKWEALYPYAMFEQYPGMTVFSAVRPFTGGCINEVQFFRGMAPEYVFETAVAAYLETAEEDDRVLENIQIDMDMNDGDLKGTFHPVLKSYIMHYRSFIKENTP